MDNILKMGKNLERGMEEEKKKIVKKGKKKRKKEVIPII